MSSKNKKMRRLWPTYSHTEPIVTYKRDDKGRIISSERIGWRDIDRKGNLMCLRYA